MPEDDRLTVIPISALAGILQGAKYPEQKSNRRDIHLDTS
jgi:hypothetical protein